jgi:hypothetical protein
VKDVEIFRQLHIELYGCRWGARWLLSRSVAVENWRKKVMEIFRINRLVHTITIKCFFSPSQTTEVVE